MDIKSILFKGIRIAERMAPTALGMDKRNLATTYVLGVVESVDGMLPAVGAFMDLPIVDGLEHKVVEAAIEWGFAFLTVSGQQILDKLEDQLTDDVIVDTIE